MVCLYSQLQYEQRGLLVHEHLDVVKRRLSGLARVPSLKAPVLLFITLLLFLCVSQAFTAQSSQRRPGDQAPLSCCQPHPKASHLSLFCPFLLFSLLVG